MAFDFCVSGCNCWLGVLAQLTQVSSRRHGIGGEDALHEHPCSRTQEESAASSAQSQGHPGSGKARDEEGAQEELASGAQSQGRPDSGNARDEEGTQEQSASSAQSRLHLGSGGARNELLGRRRDLERAQLNALFGPDHSQLRVNNDEDADSLCTGTWSDVSGGGHTPVTADSGDSTDMDRRWNMLPDPHRRVRQGDANPTFRFERVERPGQRPMMIGYSMDGREQVRYELHSDRDSDEEVSEAGSSEVGSSVWNSSEARAVAEIIRAGR